MMAMLWAQQILLGKKKYSDVPRLLKPQVKELLIDAGYEELHHFTTLSMITK